MAAEFNTGFHSEHIDSAFSRHAISFQSGAMNSLSEMVPMGNYFGVNCTSGMIYSGNSSIVDSNPIISQAGNPSGSSLLLDSVSGLKHDTGLAVEWSVDEQNKLDDGFVRYAEEPSIMKYIKIAATLPDKTVRDVALRCRWMTRKRRKPEEYTVGKKISSRKDKPVESSSKANLHSALPQHMATYSCFPHHLDQSERLPYDGIFGPLKPLLDQNAKVFRQITANLSNYKLQDNIDLFCHTRNNIITILNEMGGMPGMMSQMPPLPNAIDEDLTSRILSGKS